MFYKELIKRLIVSRFDAALAGGRRAREYLVELGMPPEAVFVGYDAVDNSYFQREARARRNDLAALRARLGLPERFFLMITRFVEKKNIPRTVEAYRRYRRKAREPWGLVICGYGPMEDEVKRLAASTEGFRFPGAVDYSTAPDYYAAASGYLLTSTTEQWGLVVNEAMASGLPVIVSERAGCCPDLVEDGGNGFTVDPFDTDSIARAMERLSSLPPDRLAAFGRRSEEIISEWGPERFAEGLRAAVEYARRKRRS